MTRKSLGTTRAKLPDSLAEHCKMSIFGKTEKKVNHLL